MEFIKNVELDQNVNEEIELFQKYFGSAIDFQFARAPGRINIIGEHIDYNGYSVMPMAIKNHILMVFGSTSVGKKISLRNKNEIYEPFDIDISCNDDFVINNNPPKWYNYFLCGYKGIMDYVRENNLKLENKSLFVVVSGNIPPNAGLASSSALVVCSAMVVMKAFNLNIPKITLAKLCMSCEKYIGTQGGGMDQCISIMAEHGSAMVIDFGPKEISFEPISLPKNSVFVISNSLQQMNKAASNQFNQRVVESRLAAKLLLKLIHPEIDLDKFHRMRDVQDLLKLDFAAMSKKVDELIIKVKYHRSMLIDLLKVSDEDFACHILSPNTQEMSEFSLFKRAKHIIDEANRVQLFKNINLNNTDGDDGLDNKLTILGELMNASQDSLKVLYECSSEKLDKLVDICRKAGTYGSRLTGAGWGGCVISLVSANKVDEFLNVVAESYYEKQFKDIKYEMFVTSPSDGAAFLFKDRSNTIV